jgi:hypothetical protein
MSLVRLMYASRMAKGVKPDGLLHILDASRKNNEKLGVTGALCYSSAGFLQALEGSPEAVNELFRRIVKDDRNVQVTLLAYGAIPRRRFPDWSMACFRSDEIDVTILGKYSTSRTFDPMTMGPAQAFGFLVQVAAERRRFRQRQADGA